MEGSVLISDMLLEFCFLLGEMLLMGKWSYREEFALWWLMVLFVILKREVSARCFWARGVRIGAYGLDAGIDNYIYNPL